MVYKAVDQAYDQAYLVNTASIGLLFGLSSSQYWATGSLGKQSRIVSFQIRLSVLAWGLCCEAGLAM